MSWLLEEIAKSADEYDALPEWDRPNVVREVSNNMGPQRPTWSQQ